MSALYPVIEPYSHGHLSVGGGHEVYWEACGNPAGKPVVVIHGGPGSGCTPEARRQFDPARYRIILFDQRGSGRCRPHASDPSVDLATITTPDLLQDIEQLRIHLNVERWMVVGGSWGSTLAIAYAESFPERVTEMVLVSVTTSRPADIHWLYHGVGRFFPEDWQRFREAVPPEARDGNLVEAYHELLQDPDPRIQAEAARNWCDWEIAVVSTNPRHKAHPRYQDPNFRLGFSRLVTHFFHHGAWLDDGVLLREADVLADVPCVLIHGRLDLGTPLATAYELAAVLPRSELVIVDEAGHETTTLGMTESIVAATDRFVEPQPNP